MQAATLATAAPARLSTGQSPDPPTQPRRSDLSHNQLTGGLPASWGAMDNALPMLYVLDLGFNRLGGEMPPEWGSRRAALASLTSLVVAGNNFSGPVPPPLGALPALHYL